MQTKVRRYSKIISSRSGMPIVSDSRVGVENRGSIRPRSIRLIVVLFGPSTSMNPLDEMAACGLSDRCYPLLKRRIYGSKEKSREEKSEKEIVVDAKDGVDSRKTIKSATCTFYGT